MVRANEREDDNFFLSKVKLALVRLTNDEEREKVFSFQFIEDVRELLEKITCKKLPKTLRKEFFSRQNYLKTL